jgi:hypothetical protein
MNSGDVALGEPVGGLRALAGTVQACQERLAGTVGGERFAAQETLGAGFSTEGALSYALEWLEPPGAGGVVQAGFPAVQTSGP